MSNQPNPQKAIYLSRNQRRLPSNGRQTTQLARPQEQWVPHQSEMALDAPLNQAEQLLVEQSVLDLTTGPHVLSFYREWLAANGILDSRELVEVPHGRRVRVAELLVVHQSPPTAKGFHLLTLETETGPINVIVRPQVYRRFSPLLRSAQLLLVAGVVQQEDGVTNVLAGHIGRLDV